MSRQRDELAKTLPAGLELVDAPSGAAGGEAPPASEGRPQGASEPAPAVSADGAQALSAPGWSGAGRMALSASRLGLSGDGEIPMSIADPLLGLVVADRYRILEGIGRGGMGIVYKVEHTRIGKLLAMKLLTGELTRNPEVVRRFKQEALTASRLSSPNTVQVFDFGVSEGLTYLVMELVAGEDLGRLLRVHGALPFDRVGKILIQVCSSLSEAHQQGIVHRDIKPENIMILRARDGSDLAKVLDFGLAKLREGPELNAVTSQGAIVGTPYFMSPEQVRGDPVDPRSDIYALGGVMYRALTGHYPFVGPTPMAVFTKHLTEVPLSPSERAPERGIPPSVSRIVLRALAKSPGDRFQRVEDLQAALVAEVRSLGTSSVEALLDSGAVRELERAGQRAERAAGEGAAAEIATRNEVEAYERKLRRTRYTAFASAGAVVVATGLGAARLLAFTDDAFTGVEREPNNAPGEALVVPLGRSVGGTLGKRLDASHGDRDFYAFDVPDAPPDAPPHVKVSVTALPNFAMCAMLYRAGMATPLGQYCPGRPGRDLTIDALRLDPGRHLVAVLQDLNPYGGDAPFVHENISDPYSLLVALTEPEPGVEVEPNDRVASANPLAPGAPLTGALAWARDEDVVCVAADVAGPIRWSVTDGIRDPGVVLEATPVTGELAGAPVRIHAGLGGHTPTESDAVSPWTSADVLVENDAPRCIRLRLVNDTWDSVRGKRAPSGASQAYRVEVQALGG